MNQEKDKSQEIFKVDFEEYNVLGQLATLEKQKRELEEQIEGGNKKQIPIWESVIRQIRINTKTLASIRESSCSILKARENLLKSKIIFGRLNVNEKREAKKTLEEIRKKLRNCDYNLSDYIEFATEVEYFFIVGGKVGENCHPGVDFKTCTTKFGEGPLLINSIDDLGGDIEVYFKSSKGEIISKGEMVGHHNEIDGVSQSVIELEPIENGVLEFKNKNGSFSQVIAVE